MTEKMEKYLAFGITILSIIVFLIVHSWYIDKEMSKLTPLRISYKDSFYLEINSIRYDANFLKVDIVNGNLKWCGDYDNFPVNAPGEDIFGENYLYFKVLSKKANNDTLMTIDRNRKVRYYNIRSGPCYDAIKDENGY